MRVHGLFLPGRNRLCVASANLFLAGRSRLRVSRRVSSYDKSLTYFHYKLRGESLPRNRLFLRKVYKPVIVCEFATQ